MPCVANDCCTPTQIEASTIHFKKTTWHPEQGCCTCAVNIVCNKISLALHAQNQSSSFFERLLPRMQSTLSSLYPIVPHALHPAKHAKKKIGKRSRGKRVSTISACIWLFLNMFAFKAMCESQNVKCGIVWPLVALCGPWCLVCPCMSAPTRPTTWVCWASRPWGTAKTSTLCDRKHRS